MPRDLRKYLYDIHQACDLLVEFTSNKSFADYAAEAMLRSAVERQFEIVGEALNQVLCVDPSFAERISYSNRIVAFRNRLIHGYAAVSDEVVWGVVKAHLPTLREEIAALLGS
jgi:uncharacterized protein with HEPN domain